jgi:hypothetical protein
VVAALATLLPALALLAGCSTRRVLVIGSDPPGARAYVNGVYVGTTPVEHEFVYYGDFDVRLEKPGWESLAGPVRVPTQSDGYPVVDLPQELLVRGRRFAWTGRMRRLPQRVSDASAKELYDRAKAFRGRTEREATEESVPGAIPRGFPWDEPVPPPPPVPPLPALP